MQVIPRRYFEYRNVAENSCKFWAISVVGSTVRVQWGRIGTQGQTQTKSYGTELEARAFVNKMIKEKLAKGYQEGRPLYPAPAPSPPPPTQVPAAVPAARQVRSIEFDPEEE